MQSYANLSSSSKEILHQRREILGFGTQFVRYCGFKATRIITPAKRKPRKRHRSSRSRRRLATICKMIAVVEPDQDVVRDAYPQMRRKIDREGKIASQMAGNCPAIHRDNGHVHCRFDPQHHSLATPRGRRLEALGVESDPLPLVVDDARLDPRRVWQGYCRPMSRWRRLLRRRTSSIRWNCQPALKGTSAAAAGPVPKRAAKARIKAYRAALMLCSTERSALDAGSVNRRSLGPISANAVSKPPLLSCANQCHDCARP
jgi:hypothetical protein